MPNILTLIIYCTIQFYEYTSFFVILRCVVAWIIERLDRKLTSQGLISYRHRRLVVSCSKMALDGSIISENSVWRNDGENVGQTSRKVGFVFLHVVLFRRFYCYFNFWCMFSLHLLSYGDGNPSKPHLNSNLRGKHFLFFFWICRCLWENCVPKIELTRAILRSLGDCFGTPLLRRSFLILFITTIYRSF